MERTMLHSHQDAPLRMGGFHRRYRRGSISGFSCDIAAGNRLIGGVVDDISANGFKISQVSEMFQADEHYYRTVVSGNGRHYTVVAKPCWKRKTENGYEIGFKILDVSWEWTELILTAVAAQGKLSSLRGNA